MCRASKVGEDRPDVICAGYAQKSTSKAEDVCAVTITNEVTIAGVFDGHGGPRAAERCKNELVPALLEVARSKSAAIDAPAIVEKFWDMDARVGNDGADDGTTATVLLVRPMKVVNAPNELECVIAWAGDSQAIGVDMTAQTAARARVPGRTTANHVPDNKSEVHRLLLQWKLREQIKIARERTADEYRRSPISTMVPDDRLSRWSDMSFIPNPNPNPNPHPNPNPNPNQPKLKAHQVK